jgi:hypothetical protein
VYFVYCKYVKKRNVSILTHIAKVEYLFCFHSETSSFRSLRSVQPPAARSVSSSEARWMVRFQKCIGRWTSSVSLSNFCERHFSCSLSFPLMFWVCLYRNKTLLHISPIKKNIMWKEVTRKESDYGIQSSANGNFVVPFIHSDYLCPFVWV